MATMEVPPAAPGPSKSLNISKGKDKVITLVVDSAPLIQGQPLVHLADRFITIPEVLREIRDRQARQNLAVLPFELETRAPSEESLAAVVAFSKKTGDFASLSAVDLKVLALTWLLEKEAKGIEHIRTAPARPKSKSGARAPRNRREREPTESKGDEKEAVDPADSGKGEQMGESAEAKTAEMENDAQLKSLEEEANAAWGGDDDGDAEDGEEQDGEVEREEQDEETDEQVQFSDDKNGEAEADEPSEEEIKQAQAKLDALSLTKPTPVTDGSTSQPADNDDDDGWITPKNVARKKALDMYGKAHLKREPQIIPVACITSDFAMQNVLLQMNLQLLSIDGVAITRLKSWVLRCHACYKSTKDMDKKFCPSCGNNTLIRTSVGVDSKGNVTYYLKKNFQYNNRGTKYSIPAPKGGRNNTDLVLREDQREYEKALSLQKRQKTTLDAFDLDYLGLDTKKTGKGGRVAIGYGRRNINEDRTPRRR